MNAHPTVANLNSGKRLLVIVILLCASSCVSTQQSLAASFGPIYQERMPWAELPITIEGENNIKFRRAVEAWNSVAGFELFAFDDDPLITFDVVARNGGVAYV